MTPDKTTRWTATSALTLSVLALGASLWSVGCQEDSTPRTEPLSQVPIAQPATPKPTPAPVAPTTRSGKADTGKAASKPSVVSPATDSGKLSLGRLVVTSGIEKREPVATETLTAGAGPVYAFVELANTRQVEANVVVTFEHESGKKVGFITLSVPSKQKRWRTWGRTTQIKKPGKWTVIVKDDQGAELERKDFEVQAAGDAPKKLADAR